jgi:hypothetical protein
MEEQKEPGEGPKELQQDALIEKLVVDPSKVPDVQVLVGFLGRSSEAGTWRLYLTLQLNSYVEFSAENVLHTQPLAAAQSPLGVTAVWLKQDATVKHTRTGTRQTQAEFVQGDIMSSFIAGPGTQEMTLRRPVPALGFLTIGCSFIVCMPHTLICISLLPENRPC